MMTFDINGKVVEFNCATIVDEQMTPAAEVSPEPEETAWHPVLYWLLQAVSVNRKMPVASKLQGQMPCDRF